MFLYVCGYATVEIGRYAFFALVFVLATTFLRLMYASRRLRLITLFDCWPIRI